VTGDGALVAAIASQIAGLFDPSTTHAGRSFTPSALLERPLHPMPANLCRLHFNSQDRLFGAAPFPFLKGCGFRFSATEQQIVRRYRSGRYFFSIPANREKRNHMPLHNFTIAQSTLTGLLATLLPVAVQFALFLRWLHRRMREDEIVHACVRDIALNHLPHIYNSLQAIGAKQGIALHEFPVIHFVDLGTRRHST
jgi:hypothetical protein